jgi:endogenous inhibitor of DNA gyrase (YacG/DUF329 family)
MTHAHPVNAATVEVKCQRCGQQFKARVADRARGWGKFCSKSCKAIKQTQRFRSGAASKAWKRHDGVSEMAHKKCDTCGAPAINGVYTNDRDRPIEWGCALHHDTTPITAGHGQWE